MKTLFVGNHENEWLMQGALHHAYRHIPDLEPLSCYTPHDVTKWAETLGAFVEGMDEDYLLLMLDDYWVQSVDVDRLSEAEYWIKEEEVDKADLSGDRMQFPHDTWDIGFVESTSTSRYRTSLQAAIWRKDYLLRFCQKGWTPWEFEIKGSEMAYRDDGAIIGTDEPCIRYINVLRRGEWHGQADF